MSVERFPATMVLSRSPIAGGRWEIWSPNSPSRFIGALTTPAENEWAETVAKSVTPEATYRASAIEVVSIISRTSADPVVQIRAPERFVALDAEAARQHAHLILGAVEASIGDAFLYEFAQTRIGLAHGQALELIRDMRAFRERLPKAEEPK